MSDNEPASSGEGDGVRNQGETDSVREPAWRRCVAFVATWGTIGVAIAALGSLVGRSWWLFDLASHFQVQYSVAFLVFAVLLVAVQRWLTALVACAFVVSEVLVLHSLYVPPRETVTGGPALKVLSLNVWAGNRDYQRVVDLIRQEQPDIAVLVEVDGRWREPLETLKAEWPYAEMTLGGGHLGVALLSRIPLERARIECFTDGAPVVAAQTSVNGVRVALFGVHLDRPISPSGRKLQLQQLAELAEWLDREPETVIILGDFNATSWSSPFRGFLPRSGLCDSRIGFGIQASWPSFLPGVCRIPIDHCLVSPDVHVAQRRLGANVGSDHLPVIADLRLPGADDNAAATSAVDSRR